MARTPARKAGVLAAARYFPCETDCPLEGSGFEPPVPRFMSKVSRWSGWGHNAAAEFPATEGQHEREPTPRDAGELAGIIAARHRPPIPPPGRARSPSRIKAAPQCRLLPQPGIAAGRARAPAPSSRTEL